jgi:hypothetical protein
MGLLAALRLEHALDLVIERNTIDDPLILWLVEDKHPTQCMMLKFL